MTYFIEYALVSADDCIVTDGVLMYPPAGAVSYTAIVTILSASPLNASLISMLILSKPVADVDVVVEVAPTVVTLSIPFSFAVL